MKLSSLILASALVLSLGITGCATTNNTKTTPSSSSGQTNKSIQQGSQTTSQQDTSKQPPSDIKEGTTKMLSITADLKSAIDAGDEAKVKATGPKLEDAWSPFEDNVKKKYPDLYKKIEEFLDPTITGAKATPLDKQTLGKLNEELSQALNELAAKEK